MLVKGNEDPGYEGAENPEICFETSILYSVAYFRLLEEKPRFWSIKTRRDKTSAVKG